MAQETVLSNFLKLDRKLIISIKTESYDRDDSTISISLQFKRMFYL